jgi:hypothetical protein
MNYKVTIVQGDSFLHAIVTGQDTKETVVRYLDDVLSECVARGQRRVLIEEHLDGPRLGTSDVFDIVEQFVKRAFGKISAVAYVHVNAQSTSMKFAEDVAVNRGLRTGFFPTVASAEAWLETV